MNFFRYVLHPKKHQFTILCPTKNEETWDKWDKDGIKPW